MSHHSNESETCILCEDKIKEAHRILQAAFKKIKHKYKDCHVSWAYRNKQDQDLFFQEKRTKARWPKSAHNKRPAEAIDLFQLSEDNEAIYNIQYFKDISDFLIRELFPIRWAGEWDTFKEYDHFQLNLKGDI